MLKRFHLARNIALSNFRRLSSPYKVTFALTYRCNLKCHICRIWRHPPLKEMDASSIGKIFKGLKGLGWLDLTGGEVTLRPDLLEVVGLIIEKAKRLLVFHISTNGQLPEKALRLAEEVVRLGAIPVINVGLDGPPEVHDQLRGVSGAYVKSLETFNALKKLRKGFTYLSCTISGHNAPYLEELLMCLKKDVRGFSYRDIHFNIFHRSSHYYRNQDMDGLCGVDMRKISRFLALSRRGHIVKRLLEKEYLKGLRRYLEGESHFLACQAMSASCFIDPSGKIYPCGMYERPVGDLAQNDHDLERLWNGSMARSVRAAIKETACPGCWSPCEAYPAILGRLLSGTFSFR